MPKTKKKSYHHGDLRRALLQAAIPILRNRGVVGLSLRKLASELGVSHGAPYRHFKNKTELLEGLAVSGYRTIAEICVRACRDFPDDPKQQLYEAGLGYLRYVSRNKEIANIMYGGVLSLDECGPELRRSADEAINGLFHIIDNGKQAGLYGNRDTTDLVLTSLSAMQGLSMFVSGGLLKDEALSERKLEETGARVYETLMSGMLDKT